MVQQQQFRMDGQNFYPFLKEDFPVHEVSQLRLKGMGSNFVFPGALTNLVGEDVNLLVFTGEQKKLEYLSSDIIHHPGNMDPDYAYGSYAIGANIPVTYSPQVPGSQQEVKVLSVQLEGGYGASGYPLDFDPRDASNYVRVVEGDAGLSECLHDDCLKEACRRIPKESFRSKSE